MKPTIRTAMPDFRKWITPHGFSRVLLVGVWLQAQSSVLAVGVSVLPVLNQTIRDRQAVAGVPLSLDLNRAFGVEEIDDQVVRFTSQFNAGVTPVVLDVALFSNRTPVTRTNFLRYVSDGDYNNSFIHRSVPGFVIQGGGFRIGTSGIESVPVDAPIVNEFGISNTAATVSMAKLGGNPDSATSQWFVSLGANSDNLDTQNEGFTVFGRVTKDTFNNALIFGSPQVFPIYDYSELLGSPFNELPFFNSHELGNPLISELALFPNVSLAPLPEGQAGTDRNLIYSVQANSNPTLVTASVGSDGKLSLDPKAGQVGSSVITVRATDSVGNTVEDTWILTVDTSDSYASWVTRMEFLGALDQWSDNPDGDALNNLLEYAFLGEPSVANSDGLPSHGIVESGPSGSYLTLSFPIRKFASDLIYQVEKSDSLNGVWTTHWSSEQGLEHPAVLAVEDLPDRSRVTVRDSTQVGAGPSHFMRVRVTRP